MKKSSLFCLLHILLFIGLVTYLGAALADSTKVVSDMDTEIQQKQQDKTLTTLDIRRLLRAVTPDFPDNYVNTRGLAVAEANMSNAKVSIAAIPTSGYASAGFISSTVRNKTSSPWRNVRVTMTTNIHSLSGTGRFNLNIEIHRSDGSIVRSALVNRDILGTGPLDIITPPFTAEAGESYNARGFILVRADGAEVSGIVATITGISWDI